MGKVIRVYALTDPLGEVKIDENLPSGMYFYSLYRQNNLLARNKMLVQ
jgi:hypothetical protein